MMSLRLDSTLLNRPLDMQQYNRHRIQCLNLQKLLIVDQINSWGFSSFINIWSPALVTTLQKRSNSLHILKLLLYWPSGAS